MKMERGRYRDRRIVRAIERDGEAVEGERESHRETGDVQCSLIDNSYSNWQFHLPPSVENVT